MSHPARLAADQDPYAEEIAGDGDNRRLDLALLLDPGVLRAARHLMRERTWWRALLGVIALSVLFVGLGQWQWSRHETKDAKIHRIERNYGAAPVPLATLLPATSTPLPVQDQWRPVSVSGTYLPQEQVAVRNRPLNGDGGYEILLPLRTDTGALLLVDRGWVPAGRTAAGPDPVPAPPTGRVDLVVRMRPGEPPTSRTAPAGQAMRIDLPLLAARTGGDVYAAYGVLAAETSRPDTAPTLLPKPSTDGGPHVAYTFQWYAFAVTAYVLFLVFLFREAQMREGVSPRQARRPAEHVEST